jgi:hypothetical protein
MKTLLALLILASASMRDVLPRGGSPGSNRETPTVTAAPLTLSPEGMQLILDFEVGGGAVYYNRYLIRPSWPGESSGVTIGVGYDLGYNTRAQIAKDWSMLPAGTLARLQSCAGIKGASAKLKLPAVRDILIPWEIALQVYQGKTVPRFASLTEQAYPGTRTMHPHIQSAMLSWVFNRGSGITGSARDREKREIRKAIPSQPASLPPEFRSSKRLWIQTPGLIRRREAEAKLIETATQ